MIHKIKIGRDRSGQFTTNMQNFKVRRKEIRRPDRWMDR